MAVVKRYITLVEMMIVIFIIGVLTAVLGFSYQSSLEKTRVFKTERDIEKLETILNMQVAEDPAFLQHVETDWQQMIRGDPLVKDPASLYKDGWGYEYKVSVEDGIIRVYSQGLEKRQNR
jgi:general secretion pathway protein G